MNNDESCLKRKLIFIEGLSMAALACVAPLRSFRPDDQKPNVEEATNAVVNKTCGIALAERERVGLSKYRAITASRVSKDNLFDHIRRP